MSGLLATPARRGDTAIRRCDSAAVRAGIPGWGRTAAELQSGHLRDDLGGVLSPQSRPRAADAGASTEHDSIGGRTAGIRISGALRLDSQVICGAQPANSI